MSKKKHDPKSFRIRPKLDTVGAIIARLVDEARFESWHLGYAAAVADYTANPHFAKMTPINIDDL